MELVLRALNAGAIVTHNFATGEVFVSTGISLPMDMFLKLRADGVIQQYDRNERISWYRMKERRRGNF